MEPVHTAESPRAETSYWTHTLISADTESPLRLLHVLQQSEVRLWSEGCSRNCMLSVLTISTDYCFAWANAAEHTHIQVDTGLCQH